MLDCYWDSYLSSNGEYLEMSSLIFAENMAYYGQFEVIIGIQAKEVLNFKMILTFS